jgi:hypothetical protein
MLRRFLKAVCFTAPIWFLLGVATTSLSPKPGNVQYEKTHPTSPEERLAVGVIAMMSAGPLLAFAVALPKVTHRLD